MSPDNGECWLIIYYYLFIVIIVVSGEERKENAHHWLESNGRRWRSFGRIRSGANRGNAVTECYSRICYGSRTVRVLRRCRILRLSRCTAPSSFSGTCLSRIVWFQTAATGNDWKLLLAVTRTTTGWLAVRWCGRAWVRAGTVIAVVVHRSRCVWMCAINDLMRTYCTAVAISVYDIILRTSTRRVAGDKFSSSLQSRQARTD